jgi:hypothetical protein
MIKEETIIYFLKRRFKKVKRLTIFMIAMVLAIGFAFGPLSAFAAETSGSASADIMSHYVWRGQRLSDDFVIQPSVGITYGGFGANIWANWDDTASSATDSGITETDYTLNYSFSKDKFGFDVGYIYYAFPSPGLDTQEIYLGVSYDTILSPSATLYYDFDEGDGAFLVAAVGHSLNLTEKIALNLGASASYNFSNFVMGPAEDGSTDFSGFYNGELSASVTIPVTDNISIEPKTAASFALSDDAESAIKGLDATGKADDSFVYGGVNITLSF